MRKNIKSKVKELMFKYRFILFVACIFATNLSILDAQNIEKSFEKEIEISANAIIRINAPRSVEITGNGQVNTRQVGNKYMVSTKKSIPHVYVIDKKMSIHTWEKNYVRQLVKLTLNCETEAQKNDLLEALAIELEENVAGVVKVNGELNISKFQVDNGWFREDKNSIQLKNGKDYPITYLALSTTLYIPEKSNIELVGEDNFVTIDDHLGEAYFKMKGGSLSAGRIGRLNGSLASTKIEIADLMQGRFKIINTSLAIETAENLELESSLSSIDIKTIKRLDISNTLNDDFNIAVVHDLKVDKSLFSNFDIDNCNELLRLDLKSSDLDIGQLASTLQYAIVKNQGAKVRIGLEELATFSLLCKGTNNSEYAVPGDFQLFQSDAISKEYYVGEHPQKLSIQVDCSLCDVAFSKAMQ